MNRINLSVAGAIALLAGGTATVRAQELGPVIITEIMYNPSGVDEGQEWVEIYNPTAATVDISRWFLEDDDGRSADLPNNTFLASHEVAVIAPLRGGVSGNGTARQSTYLNSQAAWNAAWGPGIRVIFVDSFWNYPGDPVPATGTLDGLSNSPSPTNEMLTLRDRRGNLIDQVVYDDDEGGETPWPDDNDSGSIQLLRQFTASVADNNSGQAWKLSRPGDALGSRHAIPGAITFPGLESYGTPGQLPAATFSDCNGNGIDDATDLVHGTAADAYPYNNIPDSCEGDCNANAVGDLTEIRLDWTKDRNTNGQLDSCEINAHGGVNGVGGTFDVNANGVLDSFENKPPVVITEIMYNPAGEDTGKEFVEIYYYGAAPINVGGWSLRDLEDPAGTGTIPANTTMNQGDVIVLIPGGGVGVPADVVSQFRQAWNLPANVRVFGLNPWQDRAQQATPLEEQLALLDASGQPVDVVNYENPQYSPNSLWPDDDGTSSIYLIYGAVNKDANDFGTFWKRSMANLDGAYDSGQTPLFSDSRATGSTGSPGRVWVLPSQEPTGEAVITEIMYNPNSNPGDETAAEWVEIYNPGPGDLDCSGWYLRDEDGRTAGLAPGSVLSAGQVMVVLPRTGAPTAPQAEAEFRAAWGPVCNVHAISGWSDQDPTPNIGGLGNSPGPGDEVMTLRRADGTVVDVVNFDDDGVVWPVDTGVAAPGLGAGWSIALLPGMYSATANDIGTNWEASNVGFDLATLNLTTATYNGIDIGSPGLLPGVVLDPACPPAPGCDPDLNQDGNADQDDIAYLINVIGGGANPTGIDADFNHDGNADQDDVSALVSVVAGGACP